jgi:hypothetical protein
VELYSTMTSDNHKVYFKKQEESMLNVSIIRK